MLHNRKSGRLFTKYRQNIDARLLRVTYCIRSWNRLRFGYHGLRFGLLFLTIQRLQKPSCHSRKIRCKCLILRRLRTQLIKKRESYKICNFLHSAESEGFEPPEAFTSTVFKTAALNHSANSPTYFTFLSERIAKVVKKIYSAKFFLAFRLFFAFSAF